MAIVNHFLEQEDKDILVIVDDDTVLSVARLASLLSCYTGEETPVLLGQRLYIYYGNILKGLENIWEV